MLGTASPSRPGPPKSPATPLATSYSMVMLLASGSRYLAVARPTTLNKSVETQPLPTSVRDGRYGQGPRGRVGSGIELQQLMIGQTLSGRMDVVQVQGQMRLPCDIHTQSISPLASTGQQLCIHFFLVENGRGVKGCRVVPMCSSAVSPPRHAAEAPLANCLV